MYSLLIIDDNPEILAANQVYLQEAGFKITACSSGTEALNALRGQRFNCIILDVLLPDADGFALCKKIRAITSAPIIFLTCMDDLDDKIKGFLCGGDDYMTKPYSLKELSARVQALIRREEMNSNPRTPDFYIDKQNRMIHTPERIEFLSEKEFKLLLLFYEHPGQVFSKEALLESLWGGSATEMGTVAVHILKLRRKIKFAEQYIGVIENCYGAGYSLIPPCAFSKP